VMRVDVHLARNAVSPSRTEFASAAVNRLLNAPVRRRKSKRARFSFERGQSDSSFCCTGDMVLRLLVAISASVGGSFV
jgi:hypothetical protein